MVGGALNGFWAVRRDLVEKFSDVRILVIGDCMRDVWITGTVDRISPEAPVPVLVRDPVEHSTLGGAGNTLECVKALGADAKGVFMRRRGGVPVSSADWPTRTRFTAGGHQLLRVDDDHLLKLPVTEEIERDCCEAIARWAQESDIIAVSDYGHGSVTWRVLDAARETGLPVVVDPARNACADHYCGVSVIKPNQRELATLFPERHDDVDRVVGIVFNTGASVVATLGARGMMVKDRAAHETVLVPGHEVPVADVTGAGDVAMAVLCCALGAGGNLLDAARLANLAASLSVQRPGTATVSRDWLLNEMERTDG